MHSQEIQMYQRRFGHNPDCKWVHCEYDDGHRQKTMMMILKDDDDDNDDDGHDHDDNNDDHDDAVSEAGTEADMKAMHRLLSSDVLKGMRLPRRPLQYA